MVTTCGVSYSLERPCPPGSTHCLGEVERGLLRFIPSGHLDTRRSRGSGCCRNPSGSRL